MFRAKAQEEFANRSSQPRGLRRAFPRTATFYVTEALKSSVSRLRTAEKEDGANGHRSAFKIGANGKDFANADAGRCALRDIRGLDLFQGAKNNVAPRFSFCENKKWRNAGAAAMMEVLKSAPENQVSASGGFV
jgi:hypothetical protein